MRSGIAKPCALLFAVPFLLLAGLPLVSNALIGRTGFFETDTMLDALHLGFGLALMIAATSSEARAAVGLYYCGAACLILAFAGLWRADGSGHAYLLDSLRLNLADNALHGALALMMFIAGASNTASQQWIED